MSARKSYDCLAFAARLRQARIALGLTEEEAAAAAGRTVETWRYYETIGRGRITEAIVRFAGRYDLNLDWLFCGDGSAKRKRGAERWWLDVDDMSRDEMVEHIKSTPSGMLPVICNGAAVHISASVFAGRRGVAQAVPAPAAAGWVICSPRPPRVRFTPRDGSQSHCWASLPRSSLSPRRARAGGFWLGGPWNWRTGPPAQGSPLLSVAGIEERSEQRSSWLSRSPRRPAPGAS
jgi:transcriptional regulator with XRE-family HTH domain